MLPNLDVLLSLILVLATLLLLLLTGSLLLIAPGASSRLRAHMGPAQSPDSRNTSLILIASLIGVAMAFLVYSRQFVFGLRGSWVFVYIREVTPVPLWILIAVLALLAASVFIGSKLIFLHEKTALFGCLVAAIFIQFLIYEIYPVPLEKIVKSDEANGFYSVAMQYSPVEALAQYMALSPSFPLHVNGNMPGKILLYQSFKPSTASPVMMGYSVLLLSSLGALLLYGICKRLFRDRLAAFYAFMLYALIPCRFFFFPILNSKERASDEAPATWQGTAVQSRMRIEKLSSQNF